MNKTLLLILCDFLLLNLLALTRWEKAEPPRAKLPPIPELAANAVTKDQDLVETMRQSLTDEKSQRDELAQKLSTADAALVSREQSLTQLQLERTRLAEEKNAVAATLTETQQSAAELSRKVTTATQEASLTRDQLVQLQRELAEKQAEADREKQQVATLQRQQDESRQRIEGLQVQVGVAEEAKKNLRETADALKGQVEVERTERAKVIEANTQLTQGLAQGVGQLTVKSNELTNEIRENRPINANVLFNDFLANRVTANFTATRKVFIGSGNRTKAADTVIVTDGQQVYALLHIADTVFSLGENGIDWESATVELSHRGNGRSSASAVSFLAQDPRIVVIPLDPSQAAALGAKVYPLATDPFKFTDAVLIDGGGRGYGEVGFKLDPTEPGFVRVDNRLFKKLFGDFSPKRGDLVLAKTGEMLGIMVNNDYCAVVKDFAPMATIRPGSDIRGQSTGAMFDRLIDRVKRLPLDLQ